MSIRKSNWDTESLYRTFCDIVYGTWEKPENKTKYEEFGYYCPDEWIIQDTRLPREGYAYYRDGVNSQHNITLDMFYGPQEQHWKSMFQGICDKLKDKYERQVEIHFVYLPIPDRNPRPGDPACNIRLCFRYNDAKYDTTHFTSGRWTHETSAICSLTHYHPQHMPV